MTAQAIGFTMIVVGAVLSAIAIVLIIRDRQREQELRRKLEQERRKKEKAFKRGVQHEQRKHLRTLTPQEYEEQIKKIWSDYRDWRDYTGN